MRTWFDPLIVYGFPEDDLSGKCISRSWTTQQIEQYALRLRSNGHMRCPVYGLTCTLSPDTGLPTISLENRLLVLQAYEKYKIYNPDAQPLGFYLALDGGYYTNHESYWPEKEEDEEEEDYD